MVLGAVKFNFNVNTIAAILKSSVKHKMTEAATQAIVQLLHLADPFDLKVRGGFLGALPLKDVDVAPPPARISD